MFRRAMRLGYVSRNPVKDVQKFKEPGGRIVYLTPDQKPPSVTFCQTACGRCSRSASTLGCAGQSRWGYGGVTWIVWPGITVIRSKNGHSRSVPMNSLVRSALLGVGAERKAPNDPEERVFKCSYTAADKFFTKVVDKARRMLREAGKDASGLEDYTWHGNHHTFASRLVMAGVDLRTVQELGGWRSLMMVRRYGHPAPAHLQQAVERLVARSTEQLARN
jgi:hypothetical protein